VEEVLEVETPAAEPVDFTPSRMDGPASTIDKSQLDVQNSRHAALPHTEEHRVRPLADNPPVPKLPNKSTSSGTQVEEVQWRHAPVKDNAIKFAVSHRWSSSSISY
jgi:hypothetical protein